MDQLDPNYETPPYYSHIPINLGVASSKPLAVLEDPNRPKKMIKFMYFTFRPPTTGPVDVQFVQKFVDALGFISNLWFAKQNTWIATIEQSGDKEAYNGVHIHCVISLKTDNSKALRDVKRAIVKAFPEFKETDVKSPMLDSQVYSKKGLHYFREKSLYCMGIKTNPDKYDKVHVDQQYFRPEYNLPDYFTNDETFFYNLLKNYLM